MPNIANLLKTEIARVARKEIKTEVLSLKKAAAAHRSEIAALKRRVQALEKEIKQANRRPAKAALETAAAAADTESTLRFTAKGLASLRKRLALSAADFGLLVGASGLSIYKWEGGQAHPRARYLPAIAALRGIGKKEAAARLLALRP